MNSGMEIQQKINFVRCNEYQISEETAIDADTINLRKQPANNYMQ